MGTGGTWEQLAPLRQMRLKYWLRAVGSSAPAAEARQWLEEQPAFGDLACRWESLEAKEQQAAAVELERLLRAAAYATRPHCVHCGQCCKNAGPTLYGGDEELLRRGVLSPAQLRTVRAGEEVFSHLEGRRVVLRHEQVTVSPSPERACRFWAPGARRCNIHQQRPVQCRAQQCWDTAEADRLGETLGLTRLDLLDRQDAAREVLEEHERSCSPAALRELAGEAACDLEGDAAGALLELLAADLELRRRLTDRGLAAAGDLPFLLGRSLEEMLRPGGLEVVYHQDGRGTLRRIE